MPNCPKWTMADLVTHLTEVLSYTIDAITGHHTERRPTEWPDLLGHWDGARLVVRDILRLPADHPVASPFPHGGTITVGDWTRRLAHEFAIHRLDAESALPTPRRTRFPTGFAEDGIDEYLAFLTPRRAPSPERDGVVEVRAGDRGWTVVLRRGQGPQLDESTPGTPDVTLTGPADDVYRALWGRPHAAGIVGDDTLLDPLAAP
ncbi:maleylpyruvate isomerase family mycothiol-dependent enzyme [Amycolatopsis jiangsuensis]|uniref:maleylpyruvate isomerase family mycothiol-dependent enzyme n=1 Tax=Amycolatopsis jiangsuensis TaxID=1181879 RepID=UPI0035E44D29